MPKSTVPSGRSGGAFTLTEVRGKVVDSIKVYQMEEALNLDIDFNDNTGRLPSVSQSAGIQGWKFSGSQEHSARQSPETIDGA
jgi:hypothetical protein